MNIVVDLYSPAFRDTPVNSIRKVSSAACLSIFAWSKALANYVLASFGKRVSRALYVSGCPLIELFGEWCGLNSLTFWAMFYMSYDHYMMIWRRDAEFRHVGSSWNDSRRVRYGGISDSVTESDEWLRHGLKRFKKHDHMQSAMQRNVTQLAFCNSRPQTGGFHGDYLCYV